MKKMKVNINDLIGLTERRAVARVESVGFRCRIIARDGDEFLGIMDKRTDRINLVIKHNKVVGGYIG